MDKRKLVRNLKIVNALIKCKSWRWKYVFELRRYCPSLPDDEYLKALFKVCLGYELNLKDPKSFNEKMNWLKLYWRESACTSIADKQEVKKFIESRIGSGFTAKTIQVWDRVDDINIFHLGEKFVIKTTHDSGGVVLCKDRKLFNLEKTKRFLQKRLKRNFYYAYREWPYKSIKPRIIAEELLESTDGKPLEEYKFFCFNGVAKITLVCKGKAHSSERTNDFCDINLKRLPFTSLLPNSTGELEKPAVYDQMLEMAEKLAQGFPLVRVDAYLVNDHIYFGELTFFHNAGMCKFTPVEWDYKIGEWLQLPKEQI